MPITCPIPIHAIDAVAFEAIDSAVMAAAYESQNALGRLFDERVYENDVAERLRNAGFTNVHTQVPLTVGYQGFEKVYRLDLVVNQMPYDIKTATTFVPEHRSQVINYAALLEIDRVKLLNFRTPRVEGELTRCPFVDLDRRTIAIDRSRWRPISQQCEWLFELIVALLHDWGAYLDSHLYEEGLIHFCGGKDRCLERVPVRRGCTVLGTHSVQCHSPEVAFLVTTMRNNITAYERQLRRLIRLLPIQAWQWINLSHKKLQFVTIEGLEC